MTSQWYKKNEQGTRIGIWFAQNAMGNMLGAFLAWGLAKHDRAGEFSIAGWKVLFICLGGLTVVLGIVLLVFLPDSPRTARFLSEPDRALAVERIKGNQTGIGNKTHKWPQVKEALLDPLTWLYCLYSVALSIFNGGVTSFFSIIIASLGYGPLDSLLYGAPGGAVLLVSVITLMHLGDRLRKRLLCGILSLCISLLGVLLIWLLPTEIKVGRLIGYYLSLVATVGFIVVLSLLSSNVSGSSKKTTVSALFFIFYAVGNLIGAPADPVPPPLPPCRPADPSTSLPPRRPADLPRAGRPSLRPRPRHLRRRDRLRHGRPRPHLVAQCAREPPQGRGGEGQGLRAAAGGQCG